MRNTQRTVRFEVERGRLVRHVSRADGRGHVQRAALAAIQEACWWIEARAKDGATTNELWEAFPDLPAPQLSVALAFLKERGCVVTRCRRNYPASICLFEDAMIEYHALEA